MKDCKAKVVMAVPSVPYQVNITEVALNQEGSMKTKVVPSHVTKPVSHTEVDTECKPDAHLLLCSPAAATFHLFPQPQG